METSLLYSDKTIERLYNEIVSPSIAEEGIVGNIIDLILIIYKKLKDFIKTVWYKFFGTMRRLQMFCNFYFNKISKYTKDSFTTDTRENKKKIDRVLNNAISPMGMNALLTQVDALMSITIHSNNAFISSSDYKKLKDILVLTKKFCTDTVVPNSGYRFFIISENNNIFESNKTNLKTFIKEISGTFNLSSYYDRVYCLTNKNALSNYFIGGNDGIDGDNIPANRAVDTEKELTTSAKVTLSNLHKKATNIFDYIIKKSNFIDNMVDTINKRIKDIKKDKTKEEEVIILKGYTSLLNSHTRAALLSMEIYKDFLKKIYNNL